MWNSPDTAIAVVGFAGRMPGAATVEAIWPILEAGQCVIRSIRPEEAEDGRAEGINPLAPNWVGVAADIPDAYEFDAGFFGMTKRDAELMDPQHRFLMECASGALQHAGIWPQMFDGRIGLYVGATMSRYLLRLLSNQHLRYEFGSDQIAFGNNLDYLATAISYRLGLTGPCLTIQTACSTSLVCVHAAVESLLADECELALAGGVSIRVPQVTGYMFRDGGILSADGTVRPFDASARGTVIGNGGGIVVLQRLEDALAQGSTIWGIVRGSAVNSDGSAKVGFTAPSYAGQRDAVCAALNAADVAPETISYVEAHGTGTTVGDPIEFAALTDAFRLCGAKQRQYCSIGSIKANIGHLDAAAGVAGLLKLLLMFKHGRTVPLAGFKTGNPLISFGDSPFFVTRVAADWPCEGGVPRRAFISSLGIGGTNAHIVLEEAPPRAVRPLMLGSEILALSAHTSEALNATKYQLAEALAGMAEAEPADLARTLQEGRPIRGLRWTAVVSTRDEALSALRAQSADPQSDERVAPRLIWAFSGQGAGYDQRIANVIEAERVARDTCDGCIAVLPAELRDQLARVLYKGITNEPLAQSTVFVLQIALAELWKSWGVHPVAVVGHSLGEYAAAVTAGIFDLNTALELVVERQSLMARAPAGVMLAVEAPHAIVEALLPGDLDIAVRNTPQRCVIAGPHAGIEQFSQKLSSVGIPNRKLATLGAFHSRLMQSAVRPFLEAVSGKSRSRALLPFLSGMTGLWETPERTTSAEYWATQIRGTVEFAGALGLLAEGGGWVALEIGTDGTLTTLATEVGLRAIPTLGGGRQGPRAPLLEAAACLWQNGCSLDWPAMRRNSAARRVPLPPTELHRVRLLIEASPDSRAPVREEDHEQWFQVPCWTAKPFIPQDRGDFSQRRVVLIGSESEMASKIATRLTDEAALVHQVSADFLQVGGDIAEASARLVATLQWSAQKLGDLPTDIIDVSGTVATSCKDPTFAFFRALSSLRAAAALQSSSLQGLVVLSAGADAVIPGDIPSPELGMLSGLCLVGRQEFGHLQVQRIDMPQHAQSNDLDMLLSVLRAGIDSPEIGIRQGAVWSLSFETVSLPRRRSGFRRGGTYMILGGLGRFGLAIASYLRREYEAHVVLVTRGLESSGIADPKAVHRATQLAQSAALAGSYRVEHAELSDLASVEAMFQRVEASGRINGVIHAAGSIDFNAYVTLEEMDNAAAQMHFGPKVKGLCHLERILSEREVDFCLFISSLSPFLGGLGLGAYAAAHSFMDRAAVRFRAKGIRCQTINWEGWLPQAAEAQSRLGQDLTTFGLSDAEMAACAERLIAVPELLQGIVATTDLNRRRRAWTNSLHSEAKGNSVAIESSPSGARTMLRAIVTDLLGKDDIGDSDNLFELGANSLTAVQLAARVRKTGRELRLRAIFETPTIDAMAEAICASDANARESRPGGAD